MERKSRSTLYKLSWTVLAGLLTGCAVPPKSPPAVPARIPALPTQARQPATPSECLPTCLANLTKERGFMQKRLTGQE